MALNLGYPNFKIDIMIKKICTFLLSILFFSCYLPVENNPFGINCLRFKNYFQEPTILPDDIVNMFDEKIEPDSCFLHLTKIFSSREEEISILLEDFLGKKNFVFPCSKKMTDSQVKFFAKQRVVNFCMDDLNYLKNDTSSTSSLMPFERFYNFWYLGKITLHPNYESCLILMRATDNENCFNFSFLFLLNVIGRQLLSITRIADYCIFAGEGSASYIKMEKNNMFSYKIITYSEAIKTDKNGNILDNGVSERICGRYKFNKQGYVK
jgi:hypothetical protein